MSAPHLAGDWTAELVAPDGGRTWIRARSAQGLVGAARDALAVPEKRGPPARMGTIANLVRTSPTGYVTPTLVARAIGIRVAAAYTLLLRLRGAGLLVRLERGVYALPQKESA